ncbi:MAG: hypothetical protein ABSA21_09460 [Candidatus Limnocylindrales bacterium]|jgi:hypothetical protein
MTHAIFGVMPLAIFGVRDSILAIIAAVVVIIVAAIWWLIGRRK